MITVTEEAKKRIQDLMQEQSFGSEYFVRVGVTGGGCSGLKNLLEFDNVEKEGDQIFEDNGFKIVCDIRSIIYLFGTELDFSGGLNGKGFVFNNPNATRECACKQSFSV